MAHPEQTDRDWGGLLVALACIALGVWVLFESNTFSRFASIFPRAVAIAMILASASWVVLVALGIGRRGEPAEGSKWRPLGLIGVSITWATLIPVLGFIPASILGFTGAMLLGKFDSWSLRTWLGHLAFAVLATVLAYALFAWGLNVPL